MIIYFYNNFLGLNWREGRENVYIKLAIKYFLQTNKTTNFLSVVYILLLLLFVTKLFHKKRKLYTKKNTASPVLFKF